MSRLIRSTNIIRYKNTFGKYNILVTESMVNRNRGESGCSTTELYQAHLIIHNDEIEKNSTGIEIDTNGRESKEIVELFEKLIKRKETIKKINEQH